MPPTKHLGREGALNSIAVSGLNAGMEKMTTIYVALLNEGTDCWRPVEASLQGEGTYLLSGTVPESEEWEFAPGATVECKEKNFAQGKVGLVAVRRVG